MVRVVVVKYPGWPESGRQDPEARRGGSQGAGTGGRFLAAPRVGAEGARREAGLYPCRPGDEGRLVPVPREAPRGPVSASVSVSVSVALDPPRARVSAEAPAGRGQARVLRSPPGEGCSAVADFEGGSGSRRPGLTAGVSGLVVLGWDA